MKKILSIALTGKSDAWMSLRMWEQFPGAGDKSFAGGGNR